MPTNTAQRQIHSAANLIPDPTTEEYERLKTDIREHGLRMPIVLTPDGQILDGRTRDRACRELHIVPTPSRQAATEEMLDPAAMVLSLNAIRRHLSADQITAIYLQQQRAKAPADDRASREALSPKRSKKGEGKSAKKIAKKIGVSRATVERVQQVQRNAPEKLADVAMGTVSANEVLKAVKPPKLTTAVPDATVTRDPDATPPTGIIEYPESAVPSFELQCNQIEAALGWLEVRQEHGRFRPEEVVLLGILYARFGVLMKREEVTVAGRGTLLTPASGGC